MNGSEQDERAWGSFWQREASRGEGGGCLPTAYEAIDAAQREIWHEFASRLPKNAAVLDIATGDGRVMKHLLSDRRDLKPVGVDRAPSLPPAPRGASVKAGIAMENLPFPADKFAAVTSQFGFEYGAIDNAACEIARVLRSGGLVGLITHRKDGPVLAHNIARKAQIEWAIREQGVARKLVGMRATGLPAKPVRLREIAADGARRFGQTSAAWEIPEAAAQTLELGSRDTPAGLMRMLNSIEAQARNELGRISSLKRACETTAATEKFEQALEGADLTPVEVLALRISENEPPFADFRLLRLQS